MKILLTILTIFLLTTRLRQSQEKEQEFHLIAKYVVRDENVSPDFHHCSHEIKEFVKMDIHDCSFLLANQEFDIHEKFILDRSGKLKEYWVYRPMGPLTYDLSDLRADKKFSDLIRADKVKIKSSSEQIFDSGDTLKIEKIYYDEGLILVEKNPDQTEKQQRLIFEFEF